MKYKLFIFLWVCVSFSEEKKMYTKEKSWLARKEYAEKIVRLFSY